MHILVYINDSRTAEINSAILQHFTFPEETRLTLMAVKTRHGSRRKLQNALARVARGLGDSGFAITTLLREGDVLDQILQQSQLQHYDLFVDLRKSGRRALLPRNRLTIHLAGELNTSLLLVHHAPEELERVLICTAGEAISECTIRQGAEWICCTHAEVGLLHVLSQVPLNVDHTCLDLQINAADAIGQATPEGIHLQNGIDWLRESGVHTRVRPILRHGLVIEEILKEIQEGKYDLVIIGAHPRMKNLFLDLLMENITNRLINISSHTFLIIRPPSSEPVDILADS